MKWNAVLLHFFEKKRSCEVDIQGRNMRIFLLVKIGHLILSLQYNWHLLISWLQWSCLIGLGMHLLRQCNVDSGARSSSAGNVRSTHNIYDCMHLCCILDVLIFCVQVLSTEYEDIPELTVMFQDLRILSVSLDISSAQETVFLLKLLESCPNLQKFSISVPNIPFPVHIHHLLFYCAVYH